MTWNDVKCPYCGKDNFEICNEDFSLISNKTINKCFCSECEKIFFVTTKEVVTAVEKLD